MLSLKISLFNVLRAQQGADNGQVGSQGFAMYSKHRARDKRLQFLKNMVLMYMCTAPLLQLKI